jgi:hypothetical protein
MRGGASKILVVALTIIVKLSACNGDGPGGVCHEYSHVVTERLEFATNLDTVNIFLAAMEKYEAPISYTITEDSELSDTLIVDINAYGKSMMPDPYPFSGHVWYSDSLVIWFSARPYHQEYLDLIFRQAGRTPPCPDIWYYMIDYIEVHHSDDIMVRIDVDVK